jgi:hypothetical protein
MVKGKGYGLMILYTQKIKVKLQNRLFSTLDGADYERFNGCIKSFEAADDWPSVLYSPPGMGAYAAQ